ncbi:MAG: 16S rRNA (guanine(527)-N(7))-methyltransferase RsmG [Pseudolabrys sp.]|nr:16S rRNA (guanine(527)-N(7))-methyltransferase RsmG [Pseudolabrys sp.]
MCENGVTDLAADKARALELVPVSREVEARLDRFVALLLDWQKVTNLVAPSTLPELWTRHIADSLQLIALAPGAKTWVDFGSGGGFPGIPIACAMAETPGATVHLVESNGKKASFLREAARVTGAPAEIHAVRIENFGDSFGGKADVVTARAVAPLKSLCDQAFPLIAGGAVGLFPKGQDVEAELTETSKYWTVQADLVPSRTSPEGTVVRVRSLRPQSEPSRR